MRRKISFVFDKKELVTALAVLKPSGVHSSIPIKLTVREDYGDGPRDVEQTMATAHLLPNGSFSVTVEQGERE